MVISKRSPVPGKGYGLFKRARSLIVVTVGLIPFAIATAGSVDEILTQSSEPAGRFEPVSVLASPGLECRVHPEGKPTAASVRVFTDDDGYARFLALRQVSGSPVTRLALDCTDSAGHPSQFSADLTAEATFAPNPLNLANERGTDRPALRGDPMSFSQSELIRAGYGVRPDPSNSAEYARWLAAASLPARMLEGHHARSASRPSALNSVPGSLNVSSASQPSIVGSVAGPSTVYHQGSSYWLGAVLEGAPLYASTTASFNVPTPQKGYDETTTTAVTIWNGLGGYGTGSGLIQGGLDFETTPTAASIFSFREYCCGDGVSNNYSGSFNPSPGDQIYSQEWYCDATGAVDINGGYGCSLIQDTTTGAILSCNSPTGSPCPSVPALPLCSVSPNAPECMTLGESANSSLKTTAGGRRRNSHRLFPPWRWKAGLSQQRRILC